MKYPLYREGRQSLRLPSGRPIEDFSVESLNAGRLGPEDLGIHEETLRQQARIAEEAGFRPLARNLNRAAELTRVPAAKILEIYEALRRGNREADLQALARELEPEGVTVNVVFPGRASTAMTSSARRWVSSSKTRSRGRVSSTLRIERPVCVSAPSRASPSTPRARSPTDGMASVLWR